MTIPDVSIIMPVYNGSDKYLRESIVSILNQTFENYEYVIIDDGSADNTFNILSEFSRLDKRIKLLKNDKNKGLVKSLNSGLMLASSNLIARIDCGEIADARRVELQYLFLQNNEDYVLVSSQAEWVAMSGERLFTTKFPSTDVEIRKRLFIKDNIVIHPAVMYRKIDGLFYRDIAATAEDYDYWLRLSRYGKLFILNEPLLKMRLDPGGITYSKKIQQTKTVDLIHRSFVRSLLDPFDKWEWSAVTLNNVEINQQKLFNLFTALAIKYRSISIFIYGVFRLLAILSIPYYLLKLIQLKVRRITVSRDPLFEKYLYDIHSS